MKFFEFTENPWYDLRTVEILKRNKAKTSTYGTDSISVIGATLREQS